MPVATYRLFAWAIENHSPLECTYDGYRREICPIILGHTKGEEVALVFQTGGETSRGPIRTSQWKCLRLSNVRDAQRMKSEWQAGTSHRQRQTCVERVDYDVNPMSPYNPSQSLGRLSKTPL